MNSVPVPEFILIIGLCLSLVTVAWPMARICRRAGFSSWLGLLAVVPIANICLLWFLALASWPAAPRSIDL